MLLFTRAVAYACFLLEAVDFCCLCIRLTIIHVHFILINVQMILNFKSGIKIVTF